MKPKLNLIINSICFCLISPLVGIIIASVIVGIILAILYTIIMLLGFVSSLFFDVNFSSFSSSSDRITDVASYIILITGIIGGLIWSYIEIKARWIRHKKDGTGW